MTNAVRAWLAGRGLERYFDAFVEEGFDTMARVGAMDDEDLGAIPGMKRGHKKELRLAIEELAAPPLAEAPPLPAPAAVQWMRLLDTDVGPRLLLGAAADALLTAPPLDTFCPLSLVMIFGPARQGKSFLLSLLAGVEELFPQSAALRPCTVGVDLSPHVVPARAFAAEARRTEERATAVAAANAAAEVGGAALTVRAPRAGWQHHPSPASPGGQPGAGTAARAGIGADAPPRPPAQAQAPPLPPWDENSPETTLHAGFLDVEGQGDQARTYDTYLAAPALLISKVTLFNWMGRVQKVPILEKLAVLVAAAQMIDTEADAAEGSDGAGGGNTAADCGHGAAAAAVAAAAAAAEPVFGHLHVVLRDFYHDAQEASELIFGEEDEAAAPTSQAAAQCRERNGVRRALCAAFRSVSVWCLPAPTVSAAVAGTQELRFVQLAPPFVAAVAQLRAAVGGQLAGRPHALHRAGGRREVLSGPMLKHMMPGIAAALGHATPGDGAGQVARLSPHALCAAAHRTHAQSMLEAFGNQVGLNGTGMAAALGSGRRPGTGEAPLQPLDAEQRRALATLYADTGGALAWFQKGGWLELEQTSAPSEVPHGVKFTVADGGAGRGGGDGGEASGGATEQAQLAVGQQVAEMRLSRNSLRGVLPARAFPALGPTLVRLDVSYNALEGPLPPSLLCDLPRLEVLRASHNRLSGELPAPPPLPAALRDGGGLPALPLPGCLSCLQFVSLGHNRLSGPIPPEFGGCRQLEMLELEHNALEGELPDMFGEAGGADDFLAGKLVWLHLEHNQLCGVLPPSLGNCAALQELVLADNRGFTQPSEGGGLQPASAMAGLLGAVKRRLPKCYISV
jgi:hypothetical protein